jgi:hypothetical protein
MAPRLAFRLAFSHALLAGVLLAATAVATVDAASPLAIPPAQAPSTSDAAYAARCKVASFARRPAGQMATTMRDQQIKRCIKNRGVLLD